ncbi:phosphoribosyltransferase [Taibaiella sp. KBW10]|uniref:phosphoribosyltransferase family protein n=1 Tax=Taibaiella sp. KBW10 TaxID=2153357 RepID=UPI000F592E14|nr:phosphoribosyltransferase family protein [Taibaiella sp. KBW10]RQO30698.1 phosphoribosyltransferase [Taibaiella sp. KBW10]
MEIPILSVEQIEHKLKRMAYEIWERNSGEKELVILGIAEGGAVVAENLKKILSEICPLTISMEILQIDKKKVETFAPQLSVMIKNKAVIVVDDVAMSGKTLLYAIKPLLDHAPKKIQIAVLVDRKHKNFPVTADFIGYSIASTLQEHIIVTCKEEKVTGAYLK